VTARDLRLALESVLFVAAEPAALDRLRAALGCSETDLEAALQQLAVDLRERGIRLQRGPEGVQLVSAPEYSQQIEKFLGIQASSRLSTAAIETLAIVAYRQPIHRLQIEEIRGVNSERVLRVLLAQGLIQEVGRASGVGRPVLYGTTDDFLQRFGLESLTQLPPIEAIDANGTGSAATAEPNGQQPEQFPA
jgi:segregation and condensation protein B